MKEKKFSLVSFVFGIVNILLFFFGFTHFGLILEAISDSTLTIATFIPFIARMILAILGLVFSYIAIINEDDNGMNKAGDILSLISFIVLMLAAFVFAIVFLFEMVTNDPEKFMPLLMFAYPLYWIIVIISIIMLIMSIVYFVQRRFGMGILFMGIIIGLPLLASIAYLAIAVIFGIIIFGIAAYRAHMDGW